MVRTSKNREGIGVGVFMSWKIEYSLVRTREIGFLEDESLIKLIREYLKFSRIKKYHDNRVGYIYLHYKGLKTYYASMLEECHDSDRYIKHNFRNIVSLGMRLYSEAD